jgi:CubicO group peptidase (beta-lactamase class C family)
MFFHKRILLLMCLALLSLPDCYAQKIKRLDKSTIYAEVLSEKIQHLLDTAHVSGVEIAVFNHRKPIYIKAFGYANVPGHVKLDTSAIFYSASFSKAVFAYLVMRLVEKHVLALDTPLVNYLPKPLYEYNLGPKGKAYADLKGDARVKKITARMCLAHTSGLPNYREYEPDQKLRIKAEPGSRYNYSGEGIYLLQFVIEQITGVDYETLAQEKVFQPLHMTESSYVWQKGYEKKCCLGHDRQKQTYDPIRKTFPHADASLYTSIGDYSKFYAALLQKKGLKKPSFAEMFRPQVKIRGKQQFGPNAWVDVAPGEQEDLSYGLGIGLLNTPYGIAFFKEGHDTGWQHYSIGFPEKGIAVIIMTNSDNGERIFQEILETSIADTYTPWYWENYIPYNQQALSGSK